MKKILFLISLLGIVSCTTVEEGKPIKDIQNQRVRISTTYYNYVLDIFKIKYEGHTYICIDGIERMNGVIHDPECLKCKERENESAY